MTVTENSVIVGTENGDIEISFELLKLINGTVARELRLRRG